MASEVAVKLYKHHREQISLPKLLKFVERKLVTSREIKLDQLKDLEAKINSAFSVCKTEKVVPQPILKPSMPTSPSPPLNSNKNDDSKFSFKQPHYSVSIQKSKGKSNLAP